MFKAIKNLIFGNPMDIKEIIDRGGVFVDVRTSEEFADGHIEGALHIPLQELPQRWAELPMQTPLLLYCKAGVRSGHAQQFLEQQGFEAYNVGGYVSLKNKLDE